MDIKKLTKPRMEEYERKKRREREKQERQQLQVNNTPEVSPLFGEPVRISQSNCDDNITAALGDYSKVRNYINQSSVGILTEDGTQKLGTPTSLTSSGQEIPRLPVSGTILSQMHQPQHTPKISHHQQQSRQGTYIKQADNKPPYNGRGGYPGQPVKNDMRTSSGLAPPKGPPLQHASASTVATIQQPSSIFPPPATTIIPNGRQSSSTISSVGGSMAGMGAGVGYSVNMGLSTSNEKSFPGSSVNTSLNGRFSTPPIPKNRQKVPDKDVKSIINLMTQNYCPAPLTEIGATPHTTIAENYNLNGPNKHKYSFDVTPKAPIAPFDTPILSLTPLASPPILASMEFVSKAPIAPITSVSAVPQIPVLANSKDLNKKPQIATAELPKPKPAHVQHNSTLENDLELSDSDDDRKKSQSHSAANSSDTSQSDSSDSGSEDSSKGETSIMPHHNIQPQHKSQQIVLAAQKHHIVQQQRLHATPNSAAKKKSQSLTPIGGGISAIGGTYSSAGSSGNTANANSTSTPTTATINKTASPTETSNKWNLSIYFNKAAAAVAAAAATQQQPQQQHQQIKQNDVLVNNVAMNVPSVLPGGAEVTLELPPVVQKRQLTIAKVKNEQFPIHEDGDEDAQLSDIDEDTDTQPHKAVLDSCTPGQDVLINLALAFGQRKQPAGLSVMPICRQEIKKEAVDYATNKEQNKSLPHLSSNDFVSIPTPEIKHEAIPPSASGEDKIFPPEMRSVAKDYSIKTLSGLSSETNSSASNSDSDIKHINSGTANTNALPLPGLGGSLQIPGIPAAITAVRLHNQQQLQKPTIPNSITVTPIHSVDLLPKRVKKPRKKVKPVSQPVLDSSDDDVEYNRNYTLSTAIAPKKGVQQATTVATLKVKTVNEALAVSSAAVGTKNRRGRPRKTPVPTTSVQPQHVVVSTNNSTKGPTLTAKKDITHINKNLTTSAEAVATTTTNNLTAVRRQRVVRQNSSASTSNSAVSFNTTSNKAQNIKLQKPTGIPHLPREESAAESDEDDDSSTSSSSDSSNSKSGSSSGSDNGSCSSSGSDSGPNDQNAKKGNNTVSISNTTAAPKSRGSGGIVQIRLPNNGNNSSHTERISFGELSSTTSDDDDDDIIANRKTVAIEIAPAKSSHSCLSTSHSLSSSSSDDHSDNHIKQGNKDKKLRQTKSKPKSDKKSALTRIFNPKDGGAKRKGGQVLVVDQTEETQQQQATPKHLGAQEHNMQNSSSSMMHMQSPHVTPGGQIHSPRQPHCSILGETSVPQRTPNRISLSTERKIIHRIKTPTRTPNRTPTPTHQLTSTLQRHVSAQVLQNTTYTNAQTQQPSIVCRIDITRIHISPAWLNRNQVSTATIPAIGGSYVVNNYNPNRPPNSRTPLYDHESILNADLQASMPQKKSGRSLGSGSSCAANSGSRGSTPRSTGNVTPNSQQMARSERELSRSRESLHELAVSGKQQRLDEGSGAHNNGRQSSRSMDGGSTPKELSAPQLYAVNTVNPPNGYMQRDAMPGSSPISGGSGVSKLIVKHEFIKYEPDTIIDDSVFEAKYKAGVKEELLLKHDNEILAEKQKSIELSPLPTATAVDAIAGSCSRATLEIKPRRKRSSSSSSSTYKEKRRKNDAQIVDAQHLLEQQLPPTNHDRLNTSDGVPVVSGAGGCGKDDTVPITQNSKVGSMHSPLAEKISAERMPPPTNNSSIVMEHQTQHWHGDSARHLTDNIIQQEQYAENTSNSAIDAIQTQTPAVIKVYRSHFEKDDQVNEIEVIKKNVTFLQEAVNRKHAADRETNPFSQVALYLEAVVYFLLSGAAMELHRNDEAAWAIYRDTLALIKFISSKFRIYQTSNASQHETHNKVAILSLRCQSIISLKLYKMKRNLCRTVSINCNEFFKSTKSELPINGNTPSSAISPSNSVCSQGSGSNTPPGRILTQDVYIALSQQHQFFNYLTSSHDLWEQADRLVRQGNHRDFFIELDHENGPLTLHSSMYEVFLYVQAGLKRLKDSLPSTAN